MAPNQEAFRQALLTHLHLSLDQFHCYWSEMKRYRDQAVAHRDLKRKAIPRFPNFDVALESAYFYYGVVLSELREQGIELGPRHQRICREIFRTGQNGCERCHRRDQIHI